MLKCVVVGLDSCGGAAGPSTANAKPRRGHRSRAVGAPCRGCVPGGVSSSVRRPSATNIQPKPDRAVLLSSRVYSRRAFRCCERAQVRRGLSDQDRNASLSAVRRTPFDHLATKSHTSQTGTLTHVHRVSPKAAPISALITCPQFGHPECGP
jgi:hypothetical protein